MDGPPTEHETAGMSRSPLGAPILSLVTIAAVVASCSAEPRGAPRSGTGPPAPVAPTASTIEPTTTTAVVRSESAPATTAPSTNGATAAAPTTAVGGCSSSAFGASEFTLTAGGAEHQVRVFVPSTYSGTPLPAVLDWHGLGGDGRQQAAATRYEQLAETEGFIAVHPTGVPSVGDWRNSWQLFPTSDGRDDVMFAGALLDHLIAEWCVDADRVYSTGVSNGGFFTARLVCEMADRLAAASSVAGLYHPDGCSPARPVPYIAFHGTDDAIVPFDGDGESILSASDPWMQVFFEQVIPAEFAEFAVDAGCDPSPTAVTIDDVIRYDYAGCPDRVPMAFFEITGGGHSWPGWQIDGDPVFGTSTTTVDATVDSWEFFRPHELSR